MNKFFVVLFFFVSLQAMTLNSRGTGITEAQETQIIKWGIQAKMMYPGNLYEVAIKTKEFLDNKLSQFWVVQVFKADDFEYGRAGLTYVNDQWVSFSLPEDRLYFFVWVSPTSGGRKKGVEYLPSMLNGAEAQNFKNNLQQHGDGITDGQTTAIEKIMLNAELAKGEDAQANADFIEQKLTDSFGQTWIVQIYGGGFIQFGRGGLKYANDQWLFYTHRGENNWQYLIWVPGY